ncbi:MAG: hypothetical protein QMD22_03535 [archaeon]|nr:hypothetical protein [archaeon]
MQKIISIRPTEEIERKLERLMGIEKTERSVLIRRILNTGIDEELKNMLWSCSGIRRYLWRRQQK